MKANTKSDSVIVSIVPPMAIFAAAFFCTPYLLTMGYVISVWLLYIAPKRELVIQSKPSNLLVKRPKQ